MIKEYAIGSVSNRGILSESNMVSMFYNSPKDSFHSLYDYGDSVGEYVEKNKSISGYDGVIYMPDEFILDVDGEDEYQAQQLTIGLTMQLNDMMIPYQLYFSGTGFHVNISRSAFSWRPDKNLHIAVKKCLTELGFFDFADPSVTDKTRLIRIPLTKNCKENCGLYKTPLKDIELNLSIDEIKELAKKPRLNFVFKELQTEAKIKVLEYQNAQESKPVYKIGSNEHKPLETNFPCIQAMMSNEVAIGERHEAGLRIASHLKNRYEEDYVVAIMEMWRNRVNTEQNPFDEKELEGIIKASYEGHNGEGNNYGCTDYLKNKYCRSSCFLYKTKADSGIMSGRDMIDELVDFYKAKIAPFSFGDMLGKNYPIYPGEFIMIQAPPKSMKTFFLQNMLNFFKKKTYFLQLEMSSLQMARRFVQIENGWEKEDVEENFHLLQGGGYDFLDYVHIDYKNCYVSELSNRISTLPWKPEIVIVDHIGLMMSNNADPNFKNEPITQGLVDLARHHKVIVFAITEITKSALENGMNIASSKGSFRAAYNATKILSIDPVLNNETRKMEGLKLRTIADREGNDLLNLYLKVNGVKIHA